MDSNRLLRHRMDGRRPSALRAASSMEVSTAPSPASRAGLAKLTTAVSALSDPGISLRGLCSSGWTALVTTTVHSYFSILLICFQIILYIYKLAS